MAKSLHRIVQFMHHEVKIDDELLKPMVHCRRDTKVRWPVLEHVEVSQHEHGCSGLSQSILGVLQCATVVHTTTGNLRRIQLPAES